MRARGNHEFSRATIKSMSKSDGSSSEEENADNEDPKQSKRRFPELFRGTGQNGQILKEDLKNWSRKLHNDQPPDIFREVKIPHCQIT